MRIVALADSDSYVKWGAALVGALPAEWQRDLLVVDSPIAVSDAQLVAAVAGSGIGMPERVTYATLPSRLAELRPDAVLVATVGPVGRVLLRLVARLEPRPVLVSGLPGISIPATSKALHFRRQADLFVLHSRREVREFAALAATRGLEQRFGLATLPFTDRRLAAGDDLVFAAQAVVPRIRDDRLEVARTLRDAALADPTRRVVVKLRALPGEASTHAESHPFPELVDELGPRPDNLVFVTGPMAHALDTAAGVVTVSSTALLEAVARGIPVIALDDFGVSDALINTVFAESGLLAGRDAVIARAFRHPDAGWLDDNYFHAPEAADWDVALTELVVARRAGELAPRTSGIAVGGALRAAWDRKRAFGAADRSPAGVVALAVGVPARAVVRLGRRLRARVSARATRPALR